jgi:hypothetical protein
MKQRAVYSPIWNTKLRVIQITAKRLVDNLKYDMYNNNSNKIYISHDSKCYSDF